MRRERAHTPEIGQVELGDANPRLVRHRGPGRAGAADAHDNLRPGSGQRPGRLQTESGGTARDQRESPGQIELPDPIERTPSGRRVYTEDDIGWLDNCVRFRASGMPVATIRRFAELVRGGPGNEALRLDLLEEHEQVVVGRIAELTESLDLIRNKVTAYRASLNDGSGADPRWQR